MPWSLQGSQTTVLLSLRDKPECTPLVDDLYAETPNSTGKAMPAYLVALSQQGCVLRLSSMLDITWTGVPARVEPGMMSVVKPFCELFCACPWSTLNGPR